MTTQTLLYHPNLELDTVLQKIDEYGLGVLAFTDEQGKFVGIITDGDIRRGILNKKDIHQMINFHPKSISCDLSQEETQRKLKSLKTRHLPIVDEDNVLIDILVFFFGNQDSVRRCSEKYGARVSYQSKQESTCLGRK